MINRDVLENEILNAHSLYYSMRGDDILNFDINIQGIDSMKEKELIQLLKMLNSFINDQMNSH